MTDAEMKQRVKDAFPNDDTFRWNVEERLDGIYFCRGYDTCKTGGCQWELLNG